jgi:hypothetical protein
MNRPPRHCAVDRVGALILAAKWAEATPRQFLQPPGRLVIAGLLAYHPVTVHNPAAADCLSTRQHYPVYRPAFHLGNGSVVISQPCASHHTAQSRLRCPIEG